MRLINPGPGEQSDRLTILALKILYGGVAGKDTAHFERERATLLSQIRTQSLSGAWFDKVLELAAVNAALWHDEDELRAYRADDVAGVVSKEALWEDAAKCAFRIQELNDRRATLIDRINADAGDGGGKEKLT